MEKLVLSYESPVTANGMQILKSRYFLKNSDGSLKENTPDELFTRVAFAVSKAEDKPEYWGNRYKDELLTPLIFVPNSPVLMNMGTGAGTGSACYVQNLDDSMSSIMQTAYDAAMIEKYGGGIGFSLSDIRPKGFPITTTHGKACGPVAVLRMLSEVGTMITQGGKRDGAHMGVLEVYSPDIEEFISCKTTEGKIHNFNISVGVDKNFMDAVKEDEYIHLTWTMCRERHPVKDSDSGMGQVMDWDTCGRVEGKLIRARELFSKIIHGAWLNGEPGMVWLDRMNDDNTTPELGTIKATNPCGEQPLLSSESCNLGSIDVSKLVRTGEDGSWFDFEHYREVIKLSTRFLDNVIDVNIHPTKDTAEMNKKTRKIGLGVMGFADMLVKLGVSYDSEESVDWAMQLGSILEEESDKASCTLGAEKGDFPAFDKSPLNIKNGGTWKNMRNAWRRSIAPTGTISMIENCYCGIEPLFDLAFKKHNMSAALEGVELYYIHEELKSRVSHLFDNNGNSLEKYISEGHDVKDLLSDAHERSLFVTAGDIDYQWHIRIQAMWQNYIDSGVSKTINLPNSATEQDVWDAYMMAGDLGCKGITVYRAGSREREVLVSSTSDSTSSSTSSSAVLVRPDAVEGVTSRITTGHGKLFMTLNSNNGVPFEVFSQIGKSGQCDSAYLEAISRLVSLCLRNNIMPETIHQQLNGIVCCPVWSEGTQVHSVPDAIALGLKTHFIEGHDGVSNSSNNKLGFGSTCPECGNSTVFSEGCVTCNSCGWSKCS